MANAYRDENSIPTLIAASNADGFTPVRVYADPVTHRLLVDIAGGSGTVTDVSVVTANGFAGTVATSTTTPAITLSTTVTGILKGNGTAISAVTVGAGLAYDGTTLSATGVASSIVVGTTTITSGTTTRVLYDNAGVVGEYVITGTGNVVMSNSPTFLDDITIGTAATATGSILFNGLTSGTVTLSVADAAGTWTMKLPTTAGTNGYFLKTDGSGNTSWDTGPAASLTVGTTAIASGTDTRILYDNAGTLGEYTLTGTGTVVVMQNTPTLTTPVIGVATGTSLDVSGVLESGTNGGTGGQLTLVGSTSGSGVLKVAAVAGAAIVFQLPSSNGSNGNVLTTDGAGVTSWSAPAAATTITVANEATDTTCFPVFVTAATGDLGPKSNANLTFNSNTAQLSATLLVGTTSVTSASILASSNDSGAIGASGTAFSDLFLASGAVINFAAGNAVITHSSGIITVTTGDLRVTSANVGTNADSVPTLSSTSTLTNKTLTTPTITTANLSGAQQLAEGASIRLDPTLSADGTYTGTTITGTAGATLAFGDVVYLAAADSRWELADASAASTSGSVLVGFCVLAAASDGDPTVILLDGNIRADTAFPALTVSAPVYISETAGDIVVAQPTTTDAVIRVVGFALTADSIVVKISPDYITHT